MEADLSQIRVLEIGAGVATAFAARLLGDHGADVVKLENPEGDWTRRRGPFPGGIPDPEKSGLYLALNTNKRGAELDLAYSTGRDELDGLIAWADVLIHSYSNPRAIELGVDAATLEDKRPDLVTLQITAFGSMGPHADYRAEELTVSNAGGWANLCPGATSNLELPPLKVFGHQCGFMTGVAGATAALAAHYSARRTGVGEFIDFSAQAYTASVLEIAVPLYSYSGGIARRYGQRLRTPWGIFECRDGPLFLVCIEEDQWERLVQLMGNPDWASLEVFADFPARFENQDLLDTFLGEWLAEQSALEIYHEMQKNRICAAPVMSLAQIAESDHLKAREFFADVEHSGAGQMRHLASVSTTREGRLEMRCGAPMLGEHNVETLGGQLAAREPAVAQPEAGAPTLPLEGIRVADISWAWAGPFCAMNLAHLGAEVIHFESEGRPDLYRRMPAYVDDLPVTLNSSGMFNQWNQGKKSVGLNLAEPRAIELFKDFIESCDVVVENFATGVMDRLGLGYEVLAERNPRIILASISGYGQTGPLRNYMGYGPAMSALSGIATATGFIGGAASEVGVSMPDPTAGITTAFEVCAALAKRELTGKGRHLDISLWEATAAFAVEAWMDYAMNGAEPVRQGNRDPWMSPHGCFPAQGDDDWISIACATQAEWLGLCAELAPGLASDSRFSELVDRKRNEDALESEIGARTRECDRWELTRALQARGVAAFPSFTSEDIVNDPHLEARGFLERLPHPEVGARAHAGIPYRLRRRPNGVRTAAPVLGGDTEAVLHAVLGLSANEIRELGDAKVLF